MNHNTAWYERDNYYETFKFKKRNFVMVLVTKNSVFYDWIIFDKITGSNYWFL